MSRILGIIPARLTSSRLPGKMLLADTGRPLLQYAWEAARRATLLDDVIIATDSPEIEQVARGFGARVERTAAHPTGGDRVAEVVRRCGADAELIVNLQGDEPELPPETIDRLIAAMRSRPEIPMGTLATPILDSATLLDRSCVKVVRTVDGRALYFSRLPVPCYRDGEPSDFFPNPMSEPEEFPEGMGEGGGEDGTSRVLSAKQGVESPWLLHLGIYAYHPEFLLAITQMPQSRLEKLESLEQLRVLEAGASILVEIVRHRSVGIDTAEDYARFVERQRELIRQAGQ